MHHKDKQRKPPIPSSRKANMYAADDFPQNQPKSNTIKLSSNCDLYEIFRLAERRCNLPIVETIVFQTGAIVFWCFNSTNKKNHGEILFKKAANTSTETLLKYYSNPENFSNSNIKPARCFIKKKRKNLIADYPTLKDSLTMAKMEILMIRRLVELDPNRVD